MTLHQARERVGSDVVYVPQLGPREAGVITSVNDTYVFVRYHGGTTSQATDPADLILRANWHALP